MSTPAGDRQGLHYVQFYPVEGDTAIAELMLDEDIWSDLRLEGIDLTANGADRTATARVVLRVFHEGRSTSSEFELAEVLTLIETARAWLIKNEQGRLPLED